MSDGALVWALHLGTFRIHMYPLMVNGSVSKEIDALLRNFQPLAGSDYLSKMRGKFVIGIDN